MRCAGKPARLLAKSAFVEGSSSAWISDLVRVWRCCPHSMEALASAFASLNPGFKAKHRDLMDILGQLFGERPCSSLSQVERVMSEGLLTCRFEMFGFQLRFECSLERLEESGEVLRDEVIVPLVQLAQLGELVGGEGGVDTRAIQHTLEDTTTTTSIEHIEPAPQLPDHDQEPPSIRERTRTVDTNNRSASGTAKKRLRFV